MSGLRDPALDLLARAARRAGVRAYAVGGYVRDSMLGLAPHELDVVVVGGDALALATRFAELAGASRPVLFPRFGTAQVTLGRRRVEFATARRESYAEDSRKPQVEPATLDEDLRRRDFTVNAMVMDTEGQILDPLGGREDLGRRLLRTPEDPDRTFADDPLRMLRAVRFAAQLDFTLDPPLLPAMRRMAERARPPVLSVERVQEELRKLLVTDRPRKGLGLMAEGGLMAVLLPELEACRGVAQGGWDRDDVFDHTLDAVQQTAPDLRLRLAALFHDIGKPPTAGPGFTFYGHDRVGAEMTEAVMERLRFPHALIADVVSLVRMHMRPIQYRSDWGAGAVRRLARDGGELVGPLLDLARADVAASDYPNTDEIEELAGRLVEAEQETPSRLRVPVDGRDIMGVLGIGPGPAVGRAKSRLEEMVLDGHLEPDRDAILAYLREHPELAEGA
ncbi:MAG TPA: HD domain-containing protein [Candidatus Dormibacteraeota bacterium]|nr:HD domain-containing protein [Candidatus Dormibacteraeota bacterium]